MSADQERRKYDVILDEALTQVESKIREAAVFLASQEVAKLAQIKEICLDHLDVHTHALHEILHIIDGRHA